MGTPERVAKSAHSNVITAISKIYVAYGDEENDTNSIVEAVEYKLSTDREAQIGQDARNRQNAGNQSTNNWSEGVTIFEKYQNYQKQFN